MNPGRSLLRPDGSPTVLPGRALLFLRQVAHTILVALLALVILVHGVSPLLNSDMR